MTLPEKKDDGSAALATGVRVLKGEINGLMALGEALGGALSQSFIEAIDVIDSMKNQDGRPGRLIVAGIGKSGHVARKIAATLSSTGTPSFFVHPGEASHGDLGMVSSADVVLMLSNSGENSELSDLIHYTRRHNIPLIAMTSNPQGTLAKHADIILLMPKVPEACPNGLAPTTSTTMMMAFGDALAVTLLERMGLTPEQFSVFHPGGKLGQKLRTVREMMRKIDELPLIESDARMDTAILVLTEKNLGAVLVVNEARQVQGIITDGDLKRHMSPDLLQKPVREVMSTGPKTIEASSLAVEAVNIMTRTPGQYLTSLVVMEGGELCGMIRLQDCLQAGIG